MCPNNLDKGKLAVFVVGLLLLPALLFSLTAVARADSATEREGQQIANRLENLKRLLDKSSGAQRVLASDNELSKKIRLHAVERHRMAEEAFLKGNFPAAGELLTEAAKSMFQAIRILGLPDAIVEKKVADFEGRAGSTSVLLQALQRIAAEEGEQGAAAKTIAAVNKAVAAARVLLNNGKHDDARRLLDGGYEVAKAAVEGLRDGKTLVRELKFENDETEYHYEIDRNDTHHMLVKVLLEKKDPNAQARATVDDFVRRAGELRKQAVQKADGGAFRDAIRLLELSTKELVRAIRGAGVYIPG